MVNTFKKTVRSKKSSIRRSVGGKRRNTRRRRGGGWFSTDSCAAVKGKPLPTTKMGFYDWGTDGENKKGTYTGDMKEVIRKGKKGMKWSEGCKPNGQGKWVSDDGKISFEGPWDQGVFKGTKPPATQKKVRTDSAGNSNDVWTDESGKTCTSQRGKSLGCV